MTGTPRERPILFSGEMVRAILEGRKTQTRRLVKPQPGHGASSCRWSPSGWSYAARSHNERGDKACTCRPIRCPFGVPCGWLWVRETWGLHAHFDTTSWLCRSVRELGAADLESWELAYRADWQVDHGSNFWRPSIHMPRWASRISLRVTDIRVERLRSISEEDARAEGIAGDDYIAPRTEFGQLWDRVSPEGSRWADDPWVWAVAFEVVR